MKSCHCFAKPTRAQHPYHLHALAQAALAPSPTLRGFAPQAMALLSDVAAGLAALHARAIVHRDLKPHNVLITDSCRAKLSDMGLSKQLVPEQSSFESHGAGRHGCGQGVTATQRCSMRVCCAVTCSIAQSSLLTPAGSSFSMGSWCLHPSLVMLAPKPPILQVVARAGRHLSSSSHAAAALFDRHAPWTSSPLAASCTTASRAARTPLAATTSATPTSCGGRPTSARWPTALRPPISWVQCCPRRQWHGPRWVACWRTPFGGAWSSDCNSWWTSATGGRCDGPAGSLGTRAALQAGCASMALLLQLVWLFF